jgi:hypothetical protein
MPTQAFSGWAGPALLEVENEIPIYRYRTVRRCFIHRNSVAFSFVYVSIPTQISLSWFPNFFVLMEI